MINKIKNFFLITLGILFLIFLFYRRLIELRLPKALYLNLFENKEYWVLAIYLYLVIVFSVIVFSYVKKILEREKESSNFIVISLGKISYTLNSGLQLFHAWVINIPFIAKSDYIEYYTHHIPLWIGLKLCKFYNHPDSLGAILLFTILIIIPKSIVFFALALDVYYYEEFCYIYKVSFLLLIPLIERFFYFFYGEFIEGGCEFLDELIEIFILNKKPQNIRMQIDTSYCITCLLYKLETPENLGFRLTEKHLAYVQSLPNGKDPQVLTAEYMYHVFNYLHPITSMYLEHQIIKKLIVDKFHLILYFNYFVLWLYVLIYSF